MVGGENLYQFAVNITEWIDPLGLAKFTKKTKDALIKENETFFGVLTCEKCKVVMTKPTKSKSGVTPPSTDWQTDHIDPDSLGGANTEDNGQQLCRGCNRALSNTPGGKNNKGINRLLGVLKQVEAKKGGNQ